MSRRFRRRKHQMPRLCTKLFLVLMLNQNECEPMLCFFILPWFETRPKKKCIQWVTVWLCVCVCVVVCLLIFYKFVYYLMCISDVSIFVADIVTHRERIWLLLSVSLAWLIISCKNWFWFSFISYSPSYCCCSCRNRRKLRDFVLSPPPPKKKPKNVCILNATEQKEIRHQQNSKWYEYPSIGFYGLSKCKSTSHLSAFSVVKVTDRTKFLFSVLLEFMRRVFFTQFDIYNKCCKNLHEEIR